MLGSSTFSFLLCAVAVGSFAVEAQRPLGRADLLAGEWETASASGVDGVLLVIFTHAQGPLDPEVAKNASMQIRVYHRSNGHETWGWYRASSSVSEIVDTQRLNVAGLNVAFLNDPPRWSGTWMLDGEVRPVVLQRPHGACSSPCGEWEASRDGQRPWLDVRLHIVASSDGVRSAWMDRRIGPTDHRHGELLDIVSENPLVLKTQSALCCAIQFSGVLSPDGSTLSGEWTSLNMNLPVPQRFHLVQ